MIVDILRNMNLFVDGRGYAGVVKELKPPKLTVKTEELRAGGLDAPVEIDMGLEKLEASMALASVDAELLKQWGVMTGDHTPLVMRGALQAEDGTVKACVVTLRGRVREVDPGEWKSGEETTLTFMVALRYYMLQIADETIHEIDVLNMTRVINGVDQLEAQREALGI